MKTILVTGTAGFIGYHFAKRCLDLGHRVVSVDSINDYYDVQLKHNRLKLLQSHANFEFHQMGLEDQQGISRLFQSHRFDRVVHLAAQAGVRYSLE
ncbi:MAG: GDP-mannose 4,6-dehydratase, partial [Pirellula sp.]